PKTTFPFRHPSALRARHVNRHPSSGLRRACILGASALALCSTSCIPLLDGEDYDLRGQQVRLTFLHTSDIHSRLLPYDFSPIKTDTDLGSIPDAGPFGVATRIAAVLKRERKRADRVIHLDSGDAFQGAPIFNVNFGEAELTFLPQVGLDAAALGNHQFDAGPLNFVQKARDFATFPVLASNLIWYDRNNVGSNQASQVTAPYVIKNVKGLKVAVIGMGNVSTLTSLTEGGNSLQATPFEQNEAARAYVDLLRPLVDLVVITSHLGLTEDQSIVQGYEAFYQWERAKDFVQREANPWRLRDRRHLRRPPPRGAQPAADAHRPVGAIGAAHPLRRLLQVRGPAGRGGAGAAGPLRAGGPGRFGDRLPRLPAVPAGLAVVQRR